MKNILMKLNKQLIKRFGRGILFALTAVFVAVILIAASAVVQAADDTHKEINVALDATQPLPVIAIDKTIEIKPGLAKADLDKLNNEKDPEAIKAYIRQKADDYNIDWKLVYAIGAYESGYFKSNLAQSQNNFFGRKATSSTWMSWETPQEGIDNQFEYLKTRYFDRGLDTPEEMNHVYCEGDTWKYKVRYIMDTV